MDGIVIHEGLPDADLEQPLLVAIDSMPDEPAAATDRLDGVTVKAHTPAWVTVKLFPAIDSRGSPRLEAPGER